MKILNTLYKIFCISIFSLSLANASFAAAPTVFFSDLTDGPIAGWEGSTTKGAAVSIWGLNLGTSRGTSYVTVGGVNLTADTDYAEWGATNNPTTARGLQRITFWLRPSMSLGSTTISVTTADGSSQSIPFYTRSTGNIYFVSTAGSDSNNGFTVATAWRTPSMARSSASTGDVVYFKAGTYSAEDNWGALIDFWSNNHANGTANNSITLASYPAELANLDATPFNGYVMYHHGSGGDILNYWTFSKFKMVGSINTISWATGGPGNDDHVRFVGNDITTPANGKTALSFTGMGGQTNLYILGNYICDLGVNNRGETAADKGYSVYIEGFGTHNYIYIAYNELAYNTNGRGLQVYGHTVDDWVDNIYIYGNFIHNNSFNGAVLGGGDGGGGSYEYRYVRNLWFYNNVVADNGTSEGWAGIHLGGVGWGTDSGNYYIYSNTFYNNSSGAYYFSGKAHAVTMENNIVYNSAIFFENDSFTNGTTPTVSTNLYRGGATDIPAWEQGYTTSDPMFVDAQNYNFSLRDNSPVKNSGSTIPLFNKDYNGVIRVNSEYSIGAFENYSTTSVPLLNISIQSIQIQ